MKLKELRQIIREELKKNSKLKESSYGRLTEDHVIDYWNSCIWADAEGVAQKLADLTLGKLDIKTFIKDTEDDMWDVYRDELWEDDDE